MINERDLRQLDLNLLLVFATLMRERSTTRAAQRLLLGQSAVSMALKRLREFVGDPLFVRAAQALEPTPRACELWAGIEPALEQIYAAAFRAADFVPAKSQRIFRLGMVDDHEAFLMPRLLPLLRRRAPGLRVVFRNANGYQFPQLLESGEIELAVGVALELPSWVQARPLVQMGYRCVFHAGRLGLSPPLTLKQYVAHPHLLVTFKGDLQSRLDQTPEITSHPRLIVGGASHFMSLGLTLLQMDAIATVPEHVAATFAQMLGLSVSTTPYDAGSMEVRMLTHRRSEADAGVRWLAETIRSLYAQLQSV